ncbi:MAG: hypothetical protein KKB51_20655 [Candidatus Riflebacteria bacterium]|nr:hypothetical protein [Candidatus Riflebacteria bacterium]
MTARYNPHKIEKQARKWPVSFSPESLETDLKLRISGLWEKTDHAWADPFFCKYSIDSTLQSEYGTDATRIAQIGAQKHTSVTSLLESSFKWLAKLDYLLNTADQMAFNPIPWLEAALQMHDHIMLRDNYYSGLALLRGALRASPPGKNQGIRHRQLVLAATYPYCPLWTTFNFSPKFNLLPSLPAVISAYEELECIRFSLPKGGWHWKVFERKRFVANPIEELCRIKWVKKAIHDKSVQIEKCEEGLKLCLF